MFDKRGIALSEALFLLMILSVLTLLCLQCARMTYRMNQMESYDNDVVEKVYN